MSWVNEKVSKLTSKPLGDIFKYSLTSLVLSMTLIFDRFTQLKENCRPSRRTVK